MSLCDNPVPYINCFGVPVLNCFGALLTEPPATGGSITECSQVPGGASETFLVAVAGVTNGTCSNGSDWNTTHTLVHLTGQGCVWAWNDGGVGTVECEILRVVLEYHTPSSKWQLLFYNWNNFAIGPRGVASYTCDPGNFDGNGSSEFSLLSNDGSYANWPSTLTVYTG